MSPANVSILTFVAVSLTVVASSTLVYEMIFSRQDNLNRRFEEEFRDEVRERAAQSSLFKDLKWLPSDSRFPALSLKLRLQTLIDQAGLSITLARLAAMTGLCAVMAFGMVRVLADKWWLAGIAGTGACAVPFLVILSMRQIRLHRLCQQLPEAFDSMARGLRAGCSVQSAFQMIAQDFGSPIREEFSYCYEQQHLGISYEVALRDLARRSGIMELQIFAVALIVQRRAGGNLAELMNKLASLIRNRYRLHAKVKSLTGEGRMQAVVLTALPPLTLLAMCVVNREYAQELFDHPHLLYIAAASQAVGIACIRWIVSNPL